MQHRLLLILPVLCTFATAAGPSKAAEPKKEKPFTPGGIYREGDMKRPRPVVITPPSEDAAPSDAVVLFDGKDLSKFRRVARKGDDPSEVPQWKVENGYAEITPKGGQLETLDKFGSCQIHLEWATPAVVKGNGQGRGNSGVMLHGWGEVQVLDSHENDTYPDGQAAAIYHKYPPLVNASRKPGEWQSYDIICECAKLDAKGAVMRPARLTVIHNGVIVQHAVEMDTKVQEFGFGLQDHLNPVRYRNIWVRPLHERDEAAVKSQEAK